jgi:hypothetical protein
MNILAVYNVGKDVDGPAKILAQALGKTVYEARVRLLACGTCPLAVALFQEQEKAEESAATLNANGVATLILREEEIESDSARFIARKFELNKESFYVQSRQEESLTLPWEEIRLILLGSSIVIQSDKEIVKERKFSLGRAIATQGLMMSKTVKRTVTTKEQVRERLMFVYSQRQPTVALRETAMLYDSLGKAMQPARAANFTYVVGELIKLSSQAHFDDRLLTRAGQLQVLGPMLVPEEHLDTAAALLESYYLKASSR